MLTLVALQLAATPAFADDEGEFSVSLMGGAYFANPADVLGTSGVIAPRVGYWYRPQFGVEVDLPFLFAGLTTVEDADGQQPYGGMIPNIGIVGRLWPKQRVSLLLGASVGASLLGVENGGDLGLSDNTDVDFAAMAGPGVMVNLTKSINLRAEWRGVLLAGASGRATQDAVSNGMLLAGFTYLPSGPPDADKDGVANEYDKCPEDAEDIDEFEDTDGCPDPDNDGDGILDVADQCTADAEDMDGFEDDNGCPDLDNDGDEVSDTDDRCPMAAGLADLAGCPDGDGDGVADIDDECAEEVGLVTAFGCTDSDGDTVPDMRDACPDKPSPEGVDGKRDDGCPRAYFISKDSIVILEQVRFLSGRATIQRRSYGLLNGVAEVLKNNAGVTKVRIEGHTDNSGSDDTNMTLSQDRADSVKAYLEGQGVEAERLIAKGYGETKPIADNGTSAGRSANRRVAFEIVEQNGKMVEVPEPETETETETETE